MARRSKVAILRGAAGLLAAAVLLFVPPVPASAAGLFENIFGSIGGTFGSAPPQPQAPAYAEPFFPQSPTHQERVTESEPSGPRHVYCVRTCDGSYFPIRPHAGLSAAEACHSFCPACQTRLYYGQTIDYAVARDGSRYASLPNAYLYRRGMVANCSCNGRSAVGLAPMAPESDPTLRTGDVIATPHGLVVYRGGGDQARNFTPVKSYGGFSKSEREKLSALRVTPPDLRGTAETPVIPPATATWNLRGNRTAQR